MAGPEAVIAMADPVRRGVERHYRIHRLEPSIAALQAGSQLALANKESVVAGGHLLFDAQFVRSRSIRSIPNIPPSGNRCVRARTVKCRNSWSPLPEVRSAVGNASR